MFPIAGVALGGWGRHSGVQVNKKSLEPIEGNIEMYIAPDKKVAIASNMRVKNRTN